MSHRTSPAGIRRARQHAALTGAAPALPGGFPIPPAVLAEFVKNLYGTATWPGEPDYDQARALFNAAYSALPKVIGRCLCVSDVRACLQLARAYDLAVAARSGGHSMAGYSVCDGVVVDVAQLNSVVVDTVARTATVGPGTQFERLNAIVESAGLHLPGGGCPTVCVGGYMQGGGYGFTSRLFGMNSDNVLSFRMVLADGSLITATPRQNADLFWAVRGGTGNQFGIIVEITYRLHELGDVWGARLDWSTDRDVTNAAEALRMIQDDYIVGNADPDLGFQLLLGVDPVYGKELRVAFLAMRPGDEAAFDRALAPLRAIPGCLEITRLRDRYSRVNDVLLAGIPAFPGNSAEPQTTQQPPVKASTYSRYFDRQLSRDEWSAVLLRMKTAPSPLTTAAIEAYGGLINRVSETQSAFIHRDVILDFVIDVFWLNDGDRNANIRWHKEFIQFLDQYGSGHSCQSYPCAYQKDWRWAYFGFALPTLLSVKRKYDPTGLFRYAQAITPVRNDRHVGKYGALLFSDRRIVREPA